MESVRKVFEYLGTRKRIPETIEENVKLAIIKGVLPPDSRIDEKAIAEEFMISETSVRDSLLLLEYDGYITMKRGSGYYVAALEKGDLRNMYSLASILMKGAVKLIDNTDPFVCGLLDETIAEQPKLDNILLDRKFHVSIAIASTNEEYIRSTKKIYDKIEWWYRTTPCRGISDKTTIGHAQIVRAIKNHEGDDYSQLFEMIDSHFDAHLTEAFKGYGRTAENIS